MESGSAWLQTNPAGTAIPVRGRNPALFGFLAFSGILLFFFGVLSIANSLRHAVEQFYFSWPWLVALSLGFGLQVALFVFLSDAVSAQNAALKGEVAASGSVSATSMAACCAHHIADVLPLAGVTILSGVLFRFQPFFISIGLVSAFLGSTHMLGMVKRHGLAEKTGIFEPVFSLDFALLFKAGVFLGAIAVILSFWFSLKGGLF